MEHVNASDVSTLLRSAGGKVFSVEFVKRTTGEPRTMQCRFGVKSHLAGGEPAYDREAAGLLCVFDMEKQGYRSIPLETLRTVALGGVRYIVDHS